MVITTNLRNQSWVLILSDMALQKVHGSREKFLKSCQHSRWISDFSFFRGAFPGLADLRSGAVVCGDARLHREAFDARGDAVKGNMGKLKPFRKCLKFCCKMKI